MRRSLSLLGALVLCSCNPGRDRLLADLQSDQAQRRALAVRTLGEQGRKDDVILFTRAARDASATVRGEAAFALGRSQVPEVVDLLGELVEDSDESVQAKAVSALVAFPGEKARKFLLIQYGRRGRSTRHAIQEALEKSGLQNAARLLIETEAKSLWDRNVRVLSTGSLAERVSAAEALGQSGRTEAVDWIVPLVKDSQVPLAAGAVRALTFSRDPRAVPAILAAVGERFAEIREAGLEGVRQLQPPEALAPLLTLAREGSASSAMAVNVLSELPRSPAIDGGLCALALETEGEPAVVAARTMSSRGGCPTAALSAALGPRSPRARVQSALKTVAALGPAAREVLPAVSAQLSARDPADVALAARAAGVLGDARVAPALEALYKKEWAKVSAGREDWVKVPLSKDPLPGFDPKSSLLTVPGVKPIVEGPESGGGGYAELMAKLDARDAQRRTEQGRAPAGLAGGDDELIPDLDEAGVRGVAAALAGLGDLGVPQALPLVRRHLEDPVRALREEALLATPRLGPEGIQLAKAGLRTAPPELRGPLARKLCAVGEEGKKAVLEGMGDLPPGQALPLLDALERAGAPPSGVPAIEALLRKGGSDAVLAARLLGKLRARESVPALVEALRDPASPSRRETLLALGEIGDASTAAEVAKDLWHESPEVRAAAAQALSGLDHKAHQTMLEALGQDYYLIVRQQAAAALGAQAKVPPGAKP